MTIDRSNSLQLSLKQFVLVWNAKWPMDRYIRKKYGILFGSPEHRALNFIDMKIELTEEQVIRFEEEQALRLTEDDLPTGVSLGETNISKNQEQQKAVKMTQREIKQEFDDLDFNSFNQQEAQTE